MTPEQLEGLRELRLYHWRNAVDVGANMDRILAKPLPTGKHRLWVRKDLLKKLNKAYITHMHSVQVLNQFFKLGDTAEKDAAK